MNNAAIDASQLTPHLQDTVEAKDAAAALAAEKFPNADRERWHYAPVDLVTRMTEQWLTAKPGPASTWDVDATLQALELEAESALVFLNGQLASTAAFKERAGLTISAEEIDSDLLAGLAAQPLNYLSMATAPSPTTLTIDKTFDARKPLAIVHLFDGAASTMSHTRLQLKVSPDTKLALEEYCVARQVEQPALANIFCVADLAHDSQLEHIRWCNKDAQNWVRDWRVRVGERARFNSVVLDFGAALGRNETRVMLAGVDAFARTAGVGVVGQGRRIEHIAIMDHTAAGANSEQDYANIAATKGSVVFNGKVRVAEGADGTDSAQSNRNLLLDDSATVNTKPELEIYADEVKCAHGATTGALDESAVFYLISRGLPEPQARDLLVRAFADPVLAHIEDDALRAKASGKIQDELGSLINRVQDE